MRLHVAVVIIGLAPLLWTTAARAEEAPDVTRHVLGGSVGLRGDVVHDGYYSGAAVDTAIDYILEAIACAKRKASCLRSGSLIV